MDASYDAAGARVPSASSAKRVPRAAQLLDDDYNDSRRDGPRRRDAQTVLQAAEGFIRFGWSTILPDSLAGRRFHTTASASVVERTFADAGLKVATNRVWRGGGVWRCSSWRTAIAAARLAWIPFGSSELASSESAPLKRSEKIESEIIGIFEEGTRSRFEGAMTGAAIDDDDDDEAASSQLRGSRMSATRDCRTPGSSSLSTRWRGAVVDRRTLRETRNGAVAAGRDLCTGERTMLLAAAGTGNAETVCESSARARARTKAERLSGEVEEYMIAVDKGGGVSSRKREREPRSSKVKQSSSERVSHYVVSHLAPCVMSEVRWRGGACHLLVRHYRGFGAGSG